MDAACNAVEVSVSDGNIEVITEFEAVGNTSNEELEASNCLTASSDNDYYKFAEDGDKEAVAREVAIQANDYDIERVSSNLPSRRRYIPIKFSDYRIFAGGTVMEGKEEEEEEEDSTFDPESSKVKKTSKPATGRGRGRPRKHPPPAEGEKSSLKEASSNSVEEAQEGQEKKNIITKVPSGFKCGICGRIFSLRGNAKAHLITHTSDKPYPCDFEGCGKQLRTKESLRRHQLSHLGIKMFECPECKKKVSCNSSLQEHMARHTGAKPLSCEVCGRKFRQLAVLKRHLTTHSNDKPFACGVCGKRFAIKTYVHSHMKTHTGARPFTCDTCGKSFAHASDLKRHKITHTGQKPYACSVCSMRYSDASSRRRHEREHQNKQQYMCRLCNLQFTRAGQLRNHLMREHSSEGETLYEVQVVNKPAQETWPVNTSQPKLVSILHNMAPNIVVQQVEAVSQEGQTGEVLSEITPASQPMQVLMTTSVTTQPDQQSLTETKNVDVVASVSEDCSKAVAVSELPEDLANLQPGCTYRIIGAEDGSQVFELKLEEGDAIPFEELVNRVGLADTHLHTRETPLTFIRQEDNMLTVIQQPQSETNISDQIQSDRILDTSVHWQTDSSQDEQNSHTESEVNDARVPVTGVSVAATTAEQIIQIVESQSTIKIEPYSTHSNQETLDSVHRTEVNSDDKEHVPEISVDPWHLPVTKTEIQTNETPDYVYEPDLNSQDYYNWLSSFTEDCKLLSMPLEKEMFQKISHVQKTLSDFMASPSGVISDKSNFRVLMSITHDLAEITSRHLTFMLQNLS